jgi:hypothetical protein
MAQIEPYERPYNIVYGEDGGEQSTVNFEEGPDLPPYKARRMVTAIVFDNIQKLPEDDPEREELEKIRRTFHEASGGDLVFGKVMRWTNKKGKTRFIGIVEKGQDYTTAGQTRSQRDPNYKPPETPSARHYQTAAERMQDADREIRSRGNRPVATPAQVRQSEAERIADKMAKASRQAVEGDQ